MTSEIKPPILHILVVGFHHKLGCQVEFSYPPLISGTSGCHECPTGWKYLPTLALPDGSHNFIEDTVFFNVPSLMEPTESVYGISCYRQIPVEHLKKRTADVTRSTVQKSVCILARLPIYGYIEVKLSLIADAFFEQGDFSCTEILVKAYQQLNVCLLDDESHRPLRQFYVGLSLREIVLQWRHKTLILFKLFLLQRRTVCFGSPVRGMCALILGIASLIPRLLEKGFQEVACVRTSRPLSPMPDFTDTIQRDSAAAAQDFSPILEQNCLIIKDVNIINTEKRSSPEASNYATIALDASAAGGSSINQQLGCVSGNTIPEISTKSTTSNATKSSICLHEANNVEALVAGSGGGGGDHNLRHADSTEVCGRGSTTIEYGQRLTREASEDTSNLATLCAINPDEYRAPITIFASGNLCLPYLSLPYMDLLNDSSVLSYIIGTSNVLFQQKRQLADVFIDIEAANLETHDPELRRQLMLSTEDLRFTDFLLKHIQSPKEDAEGSEHWIREQFQGYILALLRTAVANDPAPKDNDHFNLYFMNAFKRTHCYTEWFDVRPDPEFFDTLPTGHPFAGTLSVTDMKLKIAQTIQNSESGRKINQAVNTTSRAVGGAISQAKGAFSSWWSSITTAPAVPISTLSQPSTTITTSAAEATANYKNSAKVNENLNHTQTQISMTFQNNRNNDNLYVNDVRVHKAASSSGSMIIDIDDNSENCKNQQHQQVFDRAEELEEEAREQIQQKPEGIVEIGKEAEILDRKLAPQQIIQASTNIKSSSMNKPEIMFASSSTTTTTITNLATTTSNMSSMNVYATNIATAGEPQHKTSDVFIV